LILLFNQLQIYSIKGSPANAKNGPGFPDEQGCGHVTGAGGYSLILAKSKREFPNLYIKKRLKGA
jgi:hypothetical protein